MSAAIVITVLAVLLTVMGGLELIASFSSLTFLLVSIAVCVANLKLRNVTHSAVAPIVAGIALMLITVVLLVLYLANNNMSTLYFALAAYTLIAINFAMFKWVARRRRRSAQSG